VLRRAQFEGTREYLTGSEVEALMAARKGSRYGGRVATKILIAY
jgi:hypothetical protein